MRRGDVWLTALDLTIGREIQKTRPAIVISPPEIHDHLRTVIVAPMRTGSRPAGFRVPLRFRGRDGLVVLDQIRTVAKARLVKHLGAIDDAVLERVLVVLRDIFSR